MDNTISIAKLVQYVRDVIILRACEHVHVNAHLPQLARQFTDVDIHPARILAAQRRQRTSMV